MIQLLSKSRLLTDAVSKMKALAPAGVSVELMDQNSGHVQIQGAWLVNYYPVSKKRTAYIKGTVKGYENVTPEKAIDLAMDAPPIAPATHKVPRDKNQGRYRKYKAWRIKRPGGSVCRWCGRALTIETATLEHVVPLDRGGLDCESNWDVACESCNKARGNNMPELFKG